MTRFSIKTPEKLIGPTFVGKRVNWLGDLGTVSEHGNKMCEIKLDNWEYRPGCFTFVIAGMQSVTKRDSFNYRPGDKEII